jgi:Domain of unknown function (DUF1844)
MSRTKMSEEQPTFKITDRRLFNADGSPRELPPDEKPEAAAVPAPAPDQPQSADEPSISAAESEAQNEAVAASEANAAAQEHLDQEAAADDEAFADGIPDADDPASFVNFAMSIASNAASALGMMEHPVTRKREVDLELGKHWIDVLGMLQKKTHGNLTAAEAKIIEGWLSDLRMQFVSMTSAAAAKAPAFTGRDIIGGK